jgi:hypothetical protein
MMMGHARIPPQPTFATERQETKMMRKRLISLITVVVMLAGLLATPVFAVTGGAATGTSFSDVPTTHWAHAAITWMAGQGILNGVGDGSFQPDAAVTREQFARIMVAALQLNTGTPVSQSFSDVPPDKWSYKYVETAKPYLTGFDVPGRDLDIFKPTEPAVREDMAVALVRALGLQGETPDLSVLSQFADYQDTTAGISRNLVNDAAIAVKHGILAGSSRDGALYFDAQKTLSRAEASVLVYRSLAIAGEKVTYDDLPKVTYPDTSCGDDCDDASDGDDAGEAEDTPAALVGTTVRATVSGTKVLVSWDKIDVSGFQGYKVVLSKADSTPAYPENGYFKWITDRSTTSTELVAGQGYNGGDLGGKLQAGVKYHLSITAVHDGGKKPGNTVQITLPAIPAATTPVTAPEAALPAATIRATPVTGGVKLSWSAVSDSRFRGYKVVISKSNDNPVYPEDGYYKFIEDPAVTAVTLAAGHGYKGTGGDFGGTLTAGQTYYARITAMFDSGKSNGNVITFTLP